MRDRKICIVLSLFSVTLLVSPRGEATPISISLVPSTSVVNVGDTLTVSLFADIPDPVLGWGLDVSFDPAVLAHDPFTDVAIGSSWFPASSPDGDDLLGIAFPEVSGDNILLAHLLFTAIAPGTTSLFASFTDGDFTEGFPLVSGGFADVSFSSASITVLLPPPEVPEPTSLLLSAMGALGLLGLRRRRR